MFFGMLHTSIHKFTRPYVVLSPLPPLSLRDGSNPFLDTSQPRKKGSQLADVHFELLEAVRTTAAGQCVQLSPPPGFPGWLSYFVAAFRKLPGGEPGRPGALAMPAQSGCAPQSDLMSPVSFGSGS